MATKKTVKKTVKKAVKKAVKKTVTRTVKKARAAAPVAGKGAGVVVHVNDRTLRKAIIGSRLPVLVDFSAKWCDPCKDLARVLPAIAKKFADQAMLVTVDVDESPKAVADFAIEGVPTLIFFDHGNLLGIVEGFSSRRSVESWMAKSLAGGKKKAKAAADCCSCGCR
jgi:thioredoxin 1